MSSLAHLLRVGITKAGEKNPKWSEVFADYMVSTMEDIVFGAALAGLLYNLAEFAKRAGDSSFSWSEIVPRQWLDVVQKNEVSRAVNLTTKLSVGVGLDAESQTSGQLATIFCSLHLEDEQRNSISPPPKAYLPLKELRLREDTIFPNGAMARGDVTRAYHDLWHGTDERQGFRECVIALKAAHEDLGSIKEAYLNSLLNLLERYSWCIPAGVQNDCADISLYHHSRMSAALATCLITRDQIEIEKMVRFSNNFDEPVVLLVGGDFSGVQDFIYTITSRGATSALRGRSMYLQLLTDIVTRYILTEIGLPLTNIIYVGGGYFYFLAPISARPMIDEAQEYISRVLLHHHQGGLYLAIAQESLYLNQFQGKKLTKKWKNLTQALQLQKQRRFSELGVDMTHLLFDPLEQGGNEEKLCVVCGREHPGTKPIEHLGNIRKCPACHKFEALGKDLRQARYLFLNEVDRLSLPHRDDPAGDYETILKHFGYQAGLYEKLPIPASTTSYCEALALNDETLDTLRPTSNQAIGRYFLVNVVPKLTEVEREKLKDKINDLPEISNPDDLPIKPFEAMAFQSTGVKRLGVLRMDIDDLGRIFSTGLGEKANLVRIAALSFSISLFIEGWIQQIAKTSNDEPGRALIYSIYSGGDDLFFVGAWHLLPHLAEIINSDLSRFVAHHKGIHLSGGIVLIPNKYPLYQAAGDVSETEHAVKSNPGKNALNFLQQTIPWSRFEEVKTRQQELVELDNRDVPRSLIKLLVQLYVEYQKTQDGWLSQGGSIGHSGQPQVYWGRGHWHSAYRLTRLAEQVGRQDEEIRKKITRMHSELRSENFRNIEWIGLAACWAELLVSADIY